MRKRSKFSLSNYKLLSCDLGELVPCGLTEVLPGDTFQHSTSALVRLSPLVAPVMHPLEVRIHHWFVPYRLLWDNFENFITGGPDGDDSSVFPTIDMPAGGGATVGSLADYLGVTPGVDSLEVSALPFRAYAMIYNEWYRDQDLQDELPISTSDGDDTTTSTSLQNVCWERDYFTSSRPWEQKGPAVTLPLGDEAPVVGFGTFGTGTPPYGQNDYRETGGNQVSSSTSSRTGVGELAWEEDPDNAGYPFIRADLSNATAATVGDIREAFALQRYKEARARYGSRYTEYLAYLGIRSSDARLQRPEYLGGGKQKIQFSEVLQTAEGTQPVGEMKGHGIGAMRSNRYRRFFEEHGIVLSFISLRPKTMYAQGLPRLWNKRLKEDFYQKELEHIGQQEVLNKELYAGHSDPDETFGFQDRYDEYRRIPSSIGGEFRDSTLDFWHMARQFDSDPALNSTFVRCNPSERNFAVPNNDVIYVMANHSIQARRMLTKTANSFIY